uniref:Uncharacterized protein n=1 Tax=viral metagenome TaxID=1070528 RepID=A0A6C0DQV7_9ZZZZ
MDNISGSTEIVTKTQLVEDVQRWVLIDSQLKIIHEKTKRLRDMKHSLGEKICKYMDDKPQKKIGITDGELRIYEKKDYSPLTFGYIEQKLSEIIHDKEKVEYIIQYLKENRDIKISKDIRRI